MKKPSYRNVHNCFKINGHHYPFDKLLGVAYSYIKEGRPHEKALGDFLLDWIDSETNITLKTSGSTGLAKSITYSKQAMVNSALVTGNYFGIEAGNSLLHCLSANFIAGKMMLIRSIVLGLELDIVSPTGNVLAENNKEYDFVAMVPMQVERSMAQLNQIKTLLIGGVAPSNHLLEKLKGKKTNSYITYGMTETLTHIALQNVKDENSVFTVLPNVNITTDSRGCLNIKVPYLTNEVIVTNDLVSIKDTKNFTLLGRIDNVINTGGVKVVPEIIEQKIDLLIDKPFFIGALPDDKLGQKVVLVLEATENKNYLETIIESKKLTSFEQPKEIYCLKEFIYTESKKIKREDTLSLL